MESIKKLVPKLWKGAKCSESLFKAAELMINPTQTYLHHPNLAYKLFLLLDKSLSQGISF